MTSLAIRTKARILLVEDNPDDAYMIEQAMRGTNADVELALATDGLAALDHLSACAAGSGNAPQIILLDLNMPGIDGYETLFRIRANPATRPIPVLIFSTSDRPEDILRSYAAGANSYFVKPADFAELEHMCQALLEYWYEFNRLPEMN